MQNLNVNLNEFSGLECLVIDALPAETQPTQLVVISHGFGASKDDLASFGPYLLESSPAITASCRFVFPNAPIDLTPLGMPGGRAWWEINMAQLAMINETRNFEELTEMTPDGMLAASEQLASAVREMQTLYSLDDTHTTLAGFSQGAMISTDLVLRQRFQPRHLALFSGTLLCRGDWEKMASDHPGCQVIQSHGDIDTVLPFEPSELLRDLLINNGFEVRFEAFHGGHTVPMEVLDLFSDRLAVQT